MPGPPLRHCVRMIRWTRLTLAAVAASTLTVLAQAPADAGAPDLPRPANGADAISAARRRPGGRGRGQRPELRRAAPDPAGGPHRLARPRRAHVLRRAGPMPVPRDLVEGVAPFPLDQTFLLHSRPDVDARDLPRLRRHHGVRHRVERRRLPTAPTPGTASTATLSTFNDTEKEQVQSVWQRVAEDYATVRRRRHHPGPGRGGDRPHQRRATRTTAPGRSSRTTPPSSAAVCPQRLRRRRLHRRVRRLGGAPRTPTTSRPGSSRSSSANNDTKNIAEAVSHEVGHNFGLSHDGHVGVGLGLQQPRLLLRPRHVGADHGRRLPEAGRAVEQGRVHQRQQHRRTT